MKQKKFIEYWSRTRKKNSFIYSLKWSIFLFISADIGNFVGRLIIDNWYKTTRIFLIDQIIGLTILIPIFLLLNIYIYNRNERKYNSLKGNSSCSL